MEADYVSDLEYALGEIQNIQSELETYFDPESGIILQRLEGIEARLKFVAETLYEFLGEAPSNPAFAAYEAKLAIACEFGDVLFPPEGR